MLDMPGPAIYSTGPQRRRYYLKTPPKESRRGRCAFKQTHKSSSICGGSWPISSRLKSSRNSQTPSNSDTLWSTPSSGKRMNLVDSGVRHDSSCLWLGCLPQRSTHRRSSAHRSSKGIYACVCVRSYSPVFLKTSHNSLITEAVEYKRVCLWSYFCRSDMSSFDMFCAFLLCSIGFLPHTLLVTGRFSRNQPAVHELCIS